jgi:hypothetical protein
MNTAIKHRLTEGQKRYRGYEAAKEIVNFYIPSYHSTSNWQEEYKNDLANYRLVNNQIDADEVREICNPLGIEEVKFENDLLPYNKIPTKLDLILGEELTRNETFAVALMDDDAIIEKELELEQAWGDYVNERLENLSLELSMRLNGATEDEINEQLERLATEHLPDSLANFKSQMEIFANGVLKHANYSKDLRMKKNTGFKHALISDKEIVYVGLVDGEPNYEVVNPLHFFSQKGPEVEYYEDGDYAGRRMIKTVSSIIRDHGNSLSQSDFDKLEHRTTGDRRDLPKKEMDYHREQSFGYKYSNLFDDTYIEDDIGQYGSGKSNSHFEDDLMWETHFTWKWQRKIGVLTIYDEFGEADTVFVDDTYKIPGTATSSKERNRWDIMNRVYRWFDPETFTSFELEWLWIPRVWEATRIGEDIFVDIREVPFQPISLKNPFDCKLPYHGRVYTAMNAKPISPVGRMKTFQYLYFVVMKMLSQLVGRNFGQILRLDMTQIDPELGDGDMQLAVERTLTYLRQGYMLFNSLRDAETQSDVVQSRPAIDSVNYSNSVDILNLIQLLSWLDVQIGMGFGISPQREAQMTSANVSDNQQAIIQSSNMTELYFYKHNEIWRRASQYYVNLFRLWVKDQFERHPEKDEMSFSYVLPKGSSALLRVTKDMVSLGDIGLFVTNFGKAQRYFEIMEQNALAFLQNDRATFEDISMLIKARIDGTSPEEVHQEIRKLQTKKDKQEQAQLDQMTQQQRQNEQIQIQLSNLEHEQELEKIIVKGQEDRKTEAVKAANKSSSV